MQKARKEAISLPNVPELKSEQQEYVIKMINQFIKNSREDVGKDGAT